MARTSNSICVMSADARGLCWLRVQRDAGGLHVLGNGAVAVEGGLEGRRAALRSLAAAQGLAEDALYWVLPRHEVTARMLKLPTQDAAEAERMVRLSAEEFVPYAASELLIAAPIVDRFATGESLVLAVFAHRDVVRQAVISLEEAGLVPHGIMLSTGCLVSAALALGLDKRETCVLAQVNAGGFEVSVLRDGVLQFTRGAAAQYDFRRMGEAGGEEALDELASELRGSLAAYRRESEEGAGPENALLALDWPGVENVAAALQEQTGLPWTVAPSLELPLDGEGAPVEGQPLALLGGALSALGQAALQVDLMPEELAQAHRADRQWRLLRQALVTVGIVFAAMAAWFAQGAVQRLAYIRELRQQLSELTPEAQGVAEKRDKLLLLRHQVEQNGTVLEMLSQATQAAPEGQVNITEFDYDSAKGVRINGRALSRESGMQYPELLRALAKSGLPLWAGARNSYLTPGKEYDRDIFFYQVDVPIEKDTEGEPVSATAR